MCVHRGRVALDMYPAKLCCNGCGCEVINYWCPSRLHVLKSITWFICWAPWFQHCSPLRVLLYNLRFGWLLVVAFELWFFWHVWLFLKLFSSQTCVVALRVWLCSQRAWSKGDRIHQWQSLLTTITALKQQFGLRHQQIVWWISGWEPGGTGHSKSSAQPHLPIATHNH